MPGPDGRQRLGEYSPLGTMNRAGPVPADVADRRRPSVVTIEVIGDVAESPAADAAAKSKSRDLAEALEREETAETRTASSCPGASYRPARPPVKRGGLPVGTPFEMVTVHHLDGSELALSHYASPHPLPGRPDEAIAQVPGAVHTFFVCFWRRGA